MNCKEQWPKLEVLSEASNEVAWTHVFVLERPEVVVCWIHVEDRAMG